MKISRENLFFNPLSPNIHIQILQTGLLLLLLLLLLFFI